MPKTLLCELHGKNFRNKGCVFNWLKHYDLGRGVKVKLAKETNAMTRYAGWGLQAVTAIPNKFQLGFFKIKNKSNVYVDGFYNFKIGKNFIVTEPLSLMNKANTLPHARDRKKFANCKIFFFRGKVGVTTTRAIRKGEMLWADYGNVSSHYWQIQYNICKTRVQQKSGRVGSEKSDNEDNDSNCKTCRKRHVELVMCDACRNSVCESCMTAREKYLLCDGYFFCDQCLDKPPRQPSQFAKKKKYQKDKYQIWLQHCNQKYCTTSGGTYDLPNGWKSNLTKVKLLFQKAKMTNVEFLNLKGGLANDKALWDTDVVEELLKMLDRNKTKTYGINLGETYFTKQALQYLHDNLDKTWIGFIFIEADYNTCINAELKWCFKHTSKTSKLKLNRKEKPIWYKQGTVAPWYDKQNRKFLERKETFAKCFWSPVYSKYFK